jgi:uncharacterized protein (DUF433 family)
MTDESPHIEHRNGQAMIVGHRLSVVDIIQTLRASGYSTQATADYFRIDPEIVEACRVYEARHQEEIEQGDDELLDTLERFFGAEGSDDSTIPDDESITEEDLNAYRESSGAAKHRFVVNVARRMLSDPDFRNSVEVEMARMLKEQSYGERLLEQARAMFMIGVDPGRIWVWINGLKTYGAGETWGEARNDTLDEIEYALQELWDAREAAGEGEQQTMRLPDGDWLCRCREFHAPQVELCDRCGMKRDESPGTKAP